MNRKGFTIIELLVVLIIVGILAEIAIPLMGSMKTRADAAHVLGDFDVIRQAAYDAYASHDSFPATGVMGQPPPDMIQSLPVGFTFQYKDINYRWQLLGTSDGNPISPGQALLGVEIQSEDLPLMNAIVSAFHGQFVFGSPDDFTLVIE